MSEWIAALLMLAGAFFVLVSALGALRMPDLFLRMHAATKAGTLGAGLILAAALVVFATTAVTTKAVLAFVFLLLTAPVGAHVLGRAAYYDGVPLWERTEVDALKGKYDEADAYPPDDGAGLPAGLHGRGVTGEGPDEEGRA
jgi:multicomponent Na+:H+ antiporter subunit G